MPRKGTETDVLAESKINQIFIWKWDAPEGDGNSHTA